MNLQWQSDGMMKPWNWGMWYKVQILKINYLVINKVNIIFFTVKIWNQVRGHIENKLSMKSLWDAIWHLCLYMLWEYNTGLWCRWCNYEGAKLSQVQPQVVCLGKTWNVIFYKFLEDEVEVEVAPLDSRSSRSHGGVWMRELVGISTEKDEYWLRGWWDSSVTTDLVVELTGDIFLEDVLAV